MFARTSTAAIAWIDPALPVSDAVLEMMCDAPVYRLRGRLLPLVWLGAELTADASPRSSGWLVARDAVNIVVLQADGHKFGLVVDEINDAQEIVVKPLGRHLRGTPIFAGATIMGNGRVVLILDIPAFAVKASVLSERRDKNAERADITQEDAPDPTESLLLFLGAGETRMAIPLSQITRLEELDRSSLECAGGRQVVQYRGDILPLADIVSLLPVCDRTTSAPSRPRNDTVHVLVHAKDGRQVGVVVDRILDTIEERIANLRRASDSQVAGSVVVDGRVTQILDLDTLCAGVIAAPVPARAFAERMG